MSAGPATGGGGRCPGSCPGADVRSVLCGFSVWFFFLFAHVFFFFPTISPARLPSMPLLHAPVCKLVGRVGASPLSPACAGHVFWGERAQFGSTHSGLIHTSVTLLPSSVAGEDELGQLSVAPACSSPGAAQPGLAHGGVPTELVVSPPGWQCRVPQVPGLLAAMFPAPQAAEGSPGQVEACPTPSSHLPPGADPAGCWHPCGGLWSPSLARAAPRAGPQGVGDGSRPCTATGSLSWPLAAGTSRDVALLGAWRPAGCHPCTGFVTKAWHGHHHLSHHPSRLLACPMLHPSLPALGCPLSLPEAHLHQPLAVAAVLTALTHF